MTTGALDSPRDNHFKYTENTHDILMNLKSSKYIKYN